MKPIQRASSKAEQSVGLILTDEQKCTLAVSFKTASGNPATVDGVPAWTLSDPNVVDLIVDPSGMTAVAVSKALGLSQVTVTADADLGEGVQNITGTLDVEVRAAQAVSVGISAGTPEPKT